MEQLGIIGSGAIASGLARLAAPVTDVILWARSEASAEAAREDIGDGVRVVTELSELADRTFVVEAVVEDRAAKCALFAEVNPVLGEDAILATTTSSLSIEELAARAAGRTGSRACTCSTRWRRCRSSSSCSRRPPTTTRARSEALCEALGKTAVEVPDTPGFVVNRLLFPLLFNAVQLMQEYDLKPETVDACMKLGAGHPMGPLKLLDLVGLDVSASIGEQIGAEVPARVRELIDAGRLGKKSGAGFYDYDA